jgi:hypothetical protein
MPGTGTVCGRRLRTVPADLGGCPAGARHNSIPSLLVALPARVLLAFRSPAKTLRVYSHPAAAVLSSFSLLPSHGPTTVLTRPLTARLAGPSTINHPVPQGQPCPLPSFLA